MAHPHTLLRMQRSVDQLRRQGLGPEIAPVPPAPPMEEFIRLAQAYKVAPIGPESERALLALCSCVERIVGHAIVRDILNGN